MAKYENSWRLKPFEVSKGQGKNLTAFYKEAAQMAHYLLNMPNLFALRIPMCYAWPEHAEPIRTLCL